MRPLLKSWSGAEVARMAHNHEVGGSNPSSATKQYIMEVKNNIEQAIADTIIERPHGFKVGGRQFYLYPITLGKSYLIRRIVENMKMNRDIIRSNPYMEAIRLSKVNKLDCVRLIAYHTMRGKGVLDNRKVGSRIKFFTDNLNDDEIAELLMMVFSSDNVNDFMKHLKIDKEKEAQAKVLKCKKENRNTFSFGGKSIYGTMIDYFCQRYGWTMDYIVWGISYNNLQMLMADAVTTIHLDDKELKKCRVSSNREYINADDPNNAERIRKMFSD